MFWLGVLFVIVWVFCLVLLMWCLFVGSWLLSGFGVGIIYACWVVEFVAGCLVFEWFAAFVVGCFSVLFWLRGLAGCFRFLWGWYNTRLLVVECFAVAFSVLG